MHDPWRLVYETTRIPPQLNLLGSPKYMILLWRMIQDVNFGSVSIVSYMYVRYSSQLFFVLMRRFGEVRNVYNFLSVILCNFIECLILMSFIGLWFWLIHIMYVYLIILVCYFRWDFSLSWELKFKRMQCYNNELLIIILTFKTILSL